MTGTQRPAAFYPPLSTMSEYTQVVDMRKSSVTRRSSLPSGVCSCYSASNGCSPPVSRKALRATSCWMPRKCFRKYSCPLPNDKELGDVVNLSPKEIQLVLCYNSL
jgi:hypothetical protein